jgi:hypothetical protein
MTDSDDLRDTIVPKSDQLNYDDLVTGPITVQVLGVSRGTAEQPVSIDISDHRPYKPCKSMRRVLISAWTEKGQTWCGKYMTLYGDPTVKFGGVEVGGIRISHLSHIDAAMTLKLTTTRSKRKDYKVDTLEVPQSRADKCRAYLRQMNCTDEAAEKVIGKKLDTATAADFKKVVAWAKGE